MSTRPMPGFHYVDFDEGNDGAGFASVEDEDCARIADQFLYVSAAVQEWPKFRRYAERKGMLTREACEGIERNVIPIFREFAEVVAAAIEADDLRPISEPSLRARLAHAHAYLAIHAAPENLAKYWISFSELFDIQREGTDVEGFTIALWKAAWNASGQETPAAVTFREARRNQRECENDGFANSRGHFEKVRQLNKNAPIEDPKKLDAESAPPLSEKQEAWIRSGLRRIGRLNGLKRRQVDFLVQLAMNQKDPGDDPSAIRAIRDRKLERLLPKIRQLLAESRHHC